MENLLDQYNDILTQGIDTCDVLIKPTAPDLGTLTDQQILSSYMIHKFPIHLLTKENTYNVLARFYNFYFHGTIASGDTVPGVILDTI